MDNDLDSVIDILNDYDIKTLLASAKPGLTSERGKENTDPKCNKPKPAPEPVPEGCFLSTKSPSEGAEECEESKLAPSTHDTSKQYCPLLLYNPLHRLRSTRTLDKTYRTTYDREFRPYIDPINIRPYKPPDRGYYYKFYKGDIPLIRYTLEDNGFRESVNANQEWTMMWSVSNMKSQVYQCLTKYQKVNHFPRSTEITRKDCLCKNITKMQSLYGYRHFDFVPKTFVLPQESALLAEEAEKDPGKFWIIKPAASSQGKGIFVTNSIADIPTKTQLIASRYVNDPLLLEGYKFDMRIYLAVTSINPLRLYMYEEGLARLATCKYSAPVVNNKGNKFMHLTNYSVNKYNANFVANEDPSADGVGSKWSLAALRKYFAAHGIDDEIIWRRIEEIMIKTVLAIEPIIKSSCEMYVPFRGNCFELLGFDILLDSSFNPWLLEVNLSPSLNCDAPLDQKIKGELIADLFTMIGIVPLDQRDYSDQIHAKNGAKLNPYISSGADVKGGVKVVKLAKKTVGPKTKTLSKEEKIAIHETDEEYKRRGRFRRIFPTQNYAYYKAFFEAERPLNTLLSNRLIRQLAEENEARRNASVLIPRKAVSRTKRVKKASGSTYIAN